MSASAAPSGAPVAAIDQIANAGVLADMTVPPMSARSFYGDSDSSAPGAGVLNSVLVNQQGAGNSVSVAQGGDHNTASLTQIGDFDTMSVRQIGSGNSATLVQQGSGLPDLGVTQMGGAHITITQTAGFGGPTGAVVITGPGH